MASTAEEKRDAVAAGQQFYVPGADPVASGTSRQSGSDRTLAEHPHPRPEHFKEPELAEGDLPRRGPKLKRWLLTLLLAVYYVTL